ncbi:MAG: aminotransferase class IV [Gemmatimonadota bacterium]
MTTALIETVRVIDGVAPLWPLHQARLAASAEALGLDLPPVIEPEGGVDRVVRIEVSESRILVSDREVGSTAPIALYTSPVVHRGYPHKASERAWLEAARLTAGRFQADDALLLSEEGKMVEASIWAVGWWAGESLYFPPLALGGLPSVARQRLAETVRGGIHEATVTRSELRGVALLACNAARGVVSVAALDDDAVPANHRTLALSRRFWARRRA